MNNDQPKRQETKNADTATWRDRLRRLFRKSAGGSEERSSFDLPPMSRRMQAFSMLVFFLAGAGLSWFMVSNPFDVLWLPEREPARQGTAPAAEPSTAASSVYQCPMDPQVVQDHPGDCPICGMALVEVQEAAAAGGTIYQCPMDPQVVQDHPGDCPICGMALVEVQEVAAAGGTIYQCPMHPQVVQDHPGDCPICGMALVEVQEAAHDEEGARSEDGVIRIDPVQVQNIGVVSSVAEITDIARQSRTVGILDFNADAIAWINIKFEGWIEKVWVNYVGQTVEKGQPLFEIYSPELVTTQEEYLRALDYRESLEGSARRETLEQAESLLRSTRERLSYWDITDAQIATLESERKVQRRLTISAPVSGVVAELMNEALEGMFVKPGMNLYKIADLSTVWVHADIYELDIPWIREGQPASVSFRNAPEKQFLGEVLFLYPEVSRDTRTLKICVQVPNPQRRLRPGMYADVSVQGPPVREAVTIPQSAVIHSGERTIVFVDLGNGRFAPREVELGVKGDQGRVQVVNGVDAGERVVTQAQFMLDSESRIQEAIAQFRNRAKTKAAP